MAIHSIDKIDMNMVEENVPIHVMYSPDIPSRNQFRDVIKPFISDKCMVRDNNITLAEKLSTLS